MSLESVLMISNKRRYLLQACFLSLSWTAGIAIGCYCAYKLPATSLSLMRMLPLARVSIVGSLINFLCFLLITSVSFGLKNISLLFIAAFCESLVFGLIQAGIGFAFSGAGWLMRWLLMLSSSAGGMFSLIIWLHLLKAPDQWKIACLQYAAVMIPTICLEYFFLVPFVTALFDHT